MNGPDHYLVAGMLPEGAEASEVSSSETMCYLEVATLHMASVLASVTATAPTSDGREWREVVGRTFSSASPPHAGRTGRETSGSAVISSAGTTRTQVYLRR